MDLGYLRQVSLYSTAWCFPLQTFDVHTLLSFVTWQTFFTLLSWLSHIISTLRLLGCHGKNRWRRSYYGLVFLKIIRRERCWIGWSISMDWLYPGVFLPGRTPTHSLTLGLFSLIVIFTSRTLFPWHIDGYHRTGLGLGLWFRVRTWDGYSTLVFGWIGKRPLCGSFRGGWKIYEELG